MTDETILEAAREVARDTYHEQEDDRRHGDVLGLADELYATGRRDTPTGTIIARLDPRVDRLTWLALRRTGIGSSDMSAVLGMSKYRSELDVYLDKIGATDLDSDDAGEAALWGTILEAPVAEVWAQRHGVKVRRIGTVAHVDRRHMLCDLDRYVIGCQEHERCALEVKTRSAWKADEWRDGATPEDVEAQVMHQLAVTGLDAIHVAGLVGGQRLESRVIVPDADYIADLFAVADSFWTEHVAAGVPPTISSLELLEEYLKRLTPEKGVVAELGEAEQHVVRNLTRQIVTAEHYEKIGEQAKLELKALIGEDATDVVLEDDDGERVPWWTWRSQAGRRTLNLAAVADALHMPLEQLKVEFYEPGEPFRVLRKGKGAKALEVPLAGEVADDD